MDNTRNNMNKAISEINDLFNKEQLTGRFAKNKTYNPEVLKAQAMVNEVANILFEMYDEIEELRTELKEVKAELKTLNTTRA